MWLGLSYIHRLTVSENMELHVYLEDFDNVQVYAAYSIFNIGDSSDRYRLLVDGYSGNAGDSLTRHSGQMFTTYDNDNDGYGSVNCAITYYGGWWYDACHSSNLNGLYYQGYHSSYATGINWREFRGYHDSMKTVHLKLRAV